MSIQTDLLNYLNVFRLPSIRAQYEETAREATKESLSYEQYLHVLFQEEYQLRRTNQIDRYLKASRLPLEKTLSTFDLSRLPQKVRQQIPRLLAGTFLQHQENILVFGSPGTGKTHLLCAIAQELIQKEKRIFFCKSVLLVQELLMAKKNLELAKYLKKLSKFDALLIDDIGYVQQSREEMEVLFTLLADRYERASIMMSSNLPFSKWDTLFKDAMTAAAAIDRLVHHSTILELNISSFRMQAAQSKGGAQKKNKLQI